MMSKATMLFNYVVGTAIACALFWGYSDRSWFALLHWALYYVVSILLPLRWARRTERLLNKLAVPVTDELRATAYYPVMAGVLAMLIGISLIREARIR